MVDFDPNVLAKLKTIGLYSDEQEEKLKQDRKRQEESVSKKRKEEQRKLKEASDKREAENKRKGRNRHGTGGNFHGGFSKKSGGSRVGRKLPLVVADSIHGVYGAEETINAPAASKPQDTATAPYNFIPLPTAILPSQLDGAIHDLLVADGKEKAKLSKEEAQKVREAFHAFRTDGTHYDGVIHLTIENLTPLYLGGMDGKRSFSPAGKEIIPGSELRGMTKNLLKVITCGSWHAGEDMVNRHLYYRSLIVSKPNPDKGTEGTPQNYGLHNRYAAHMVGEDSEGNPVKKVMPGFLVRRGTKYCIYPLKNGTEDMHSIVIRDYMATFGVPEDDVKKSAVRWDGTTAYVQVGVLKPEKLKTKEDIDEFFETHPKSQWFKIGKQRYQYFSVDSLDASTCCELPDDIVQEYKDDKNRRGVNLLEKTAVIGKAPSSVKGLAPFQSIVPCFFLANGSTVKAFGHGQSFRIPYDHATMKAVPAELQEPVVDFADAIFGRAGKAVSWASRVAFEDAVATSGIALLPEGRTHFLMQPNPTSFQLYLRQNAKDELVHWDTPGARIRGYKMYWHNKDGHRWQVDQAEQALLDKRSGEGDASSDKGELGRVITPIKAGATFEGRIRFRDLTKAELGALFKVYHLETQEQDNIAYKIGMGKSIGLGSIRIHAKLFLEDGTRYQQLFDADRWKDSLREADAAPFIEAFETYGRKAAPLFAHDYERTVTALRNLMDFGHTKLINWEPATAPMNGNTMDNDDKKANVNAKEAKDTRFVKRNILPEAGKVITYAKDGI